jgi:hypothetical protein
MASLYNVSAPIAAASVVATAFIVISWILSWNGTFYKKEKSAGLLVVILCTCDAGYNCAWLVKAGPKSACLGQAISMEFFGLASLCWTVAIAVHINQVIFSWKWVFSKWPLLNAVCFGCPAIIVLVTVGSGCYGHTSSDEKSWCWIRVRQDSSSRQSICNGLVWAYYGPQMIGCIFCIVLYIRSSQRVKEVLLGGQILRDQQLSGYRNDQEEEDVLDSHSVKMKQQVGARC